MKKISIFALMCMMTVSSFAMETSKCLLSHQGSLTMFDGSSIADAIKAAVKGDTIFLTSGSFPGFTLDKEVTVRGAGNGTSNVTGSISVNISGTPTLTQTLLEGLSLGSHITLNTAMDGVKIKQCNFNSFEISKTNSNIVLDRCRISEYLYQSSYIKSLDAYNCKINSLNAYDSQYCSSNVCNFYNCNIAYLYNYTSGYLKGTFINCIIYSYTRSTSFGNCAFVNTLHGWNWTLLATSSEQECYLDTEMTMSDMECGYDATTLTSKGYLGNDGTVVGCYGGTNPFTLVLSIPKVTSSKITLDTQTKKVKATLSVSSK